MGSAGDAPAVAIGGGDAIAAGAARALSCIASAEALSLFEHPVATAGSVGKNGAKSSCSCSSFWIDVSLTPRSRELRRGRPCRA